MTDLQRSEPSVVRCPECHGEPTAESLAKHNLSDMGYLHDDEAYICEDCGHEWVHGVPIGEPDTAMTEALECPVCGHPDRRVHRIEFADDEHGVRALRLHLKCPDCYYFNVWNRDVESGQRTVLIGHPETTGSIEEAQNANTYSEDEV